MYINKDARTKTLTHDVTILLRLLDNCFLLTAVCEGVDCGSGTCMPLENEDSSTLFIQYTTCAIAFVFWVEILTPREGMGPPLQDLQPNGCLDPSIDPLTKSFSHVYFD